MMKNFLRFVLHLKTVLNIDAIARCGHFLWPEMMNEKFTCSMLITDASGGSHAPTWILNRLLFISNQFWRELSTLPNLIFICCTCFPQRIGRLQHRFKKITYRWSFLHRVYRIKILHLRALTLEFTKYRLWILERIGDAWLHYITLHFSNKNFQCMSWTVLFYDTATHLIKIIILCIPPEINLSLPLTRNALESGARFPKHPKMILG